MQRVNESKNKILEILREFDMNTNFPAYLIDLLAYTGYSSYQALSLLDDEDIVKLEEFARNTLPLLLTEEEKIFFFGIFIRNIPVFCIVDGDKKLLHLLRTKCKAFEENARKRLDANDSVLKRVETKKRKIDRKLCEPPGTSRSSTTSDDDSYLSTEENNERVKEHIKLVVRSYQEKFLKNIAAQGSSYLEDQATNDINVEVKDDMAYIKCSRCDFKSKAYCEIDKKRNKRKWVLSNVNRHFKTHFKGCSENSTAKKTNANRDANNRKVNSNIRTFFLPSNVCLPSDHAKPYDQAVNSEVQLPSTDRAINLTEETSQEADLTEQHLSSHLSQDFVNSVISREEGSSKKACVSNIPTLENTPQCRSRIEKKIAHRKLSFDSNQTKITDFYDICEEIKSHILKNAILNKAFSTSANIFCENRQEEILNSDKCQELGPESFFEMIITAVNKNYSQSSAANRFPDELKNLCLYLFLTSGRLAYETLVANIPNGLPSISTLSRSLSKNYEKFGEGELAFCKLKEFLEKRNYPLHVFISEDQTAIVRRPRYDQSTNQLVGYVLANSEQTGFPEANQNVINSVSDITSIIANNDLAKNAHVFMAQPLTDGAAAFCLTLFGSNNTFKSENVLLRWEYIRNEAKKYNIVVDGFSSDGDSRCLKAMRIISGLPVSSKQETPYSPYFQANFAIDNPVPIQDTVHIGTKMKNRLLNPNIVLKMGNYEVSKDHLIDLINTVSRDKHLLCPSYLDNTDKMNFDAIDKLSSTRVTSLLTNDVCRATRQMLILTRYILDSYLDKSLSIEERVYLIWYVTLYLRLWRAWIKEQSNCTLTKNWITLNTYTCIELNAHGYLILIEKFRMNPEFVLPWLYSSQPCEKFFRQARSMTSTWSTVVNFDMLDLIRRRHRIQAIDSIINDSGEKFVFPRERNKRLGVNLRNRETHIPTIEELRNVILKARDDAIKDCKALGINMLENQWEAALMEVCIPKLDSPDYNPGEIFSLQSNAATSAAIQDEPSDKSELLLEDGLDANEEDVQDIDKDQEALKNFTILDIKDLSGQKTDASDISENVSLLSIKVNGKEMVVKKSTLCWLFFKKKGRLSSDRLIRCKAMGGSAMSVINRTSGGTYKSSREKTGKRIEKNEGNLKIQKKRSDNISDSETSVTDFCSVHSEFEYEHFSQNDDSDAGNMPNNISIQQEAYYAVCYESWYIGRVIKVIDSEKSEIKFLKLDLDKYVWPREEDKQIVNNKFIFYGPVSLTGNGPFQLNRYKIKIEQLFRVIKKKFKEFL